MENALKERSRILDSIIPELFKSEKQPPKTLIKKICVYNHLSENPSKINSIKNIKVNDEIEDIFDKYNKNVRVIEEKDVKAICPLTLSEIKNSWKGACGHTFEKDAVVSYLIKNKYCPVHGCNKLLKM